MKEIRRLKLLFAIFFASQVLFSVLFELLTNSNNLYPA
jgi:hypothetical protein